VASGNNIPMASNRYVLHVTPNANGWEVKQQGSDETEWLVDDKDNAVNHARELAKANQPSQIVIHTRDGRIETEHTYGDDPRNIPG
jgi:hypothetical protein